MVKKAKISKRRKIDHASFLPYYHQLEELLIEEIEQGRIKLGEQIPSEFELCEQFRVSRTVVRQAISTLVNKGFLKREKGRGTFVIRPKINEHLFQNLGGAYEDLVEQGIKVKTRVLEQSKIVADDEICSNLNLKPKSQVIKIKRLRIADNETISLSTTFLPYNLFPDLVNYNLVDQSLYELLETKYKIKIVRGRRSLEAVLADEEKAKLLKVRIGSPLMYLNSISYKEDGEPIEYFKAFHRGDRSKFVVTLIRYGSDPQKKINAKLVPGIKNTGILSTKSN